MPIYVWAIIVLVFLCATVLAYCFCTAAKWGDEAQERWTQEEARREAEKGEWESHNEYEGRIHHNIVYEQVPAIDTDDDTKTYPAGWRE